MNERLKERNGPDLRVLVIGDIRFPTEKAHGVWIAKMCEAFARTGAHVELWHPARRRPAADDPYSYYDVEPVFGVRTLPTVDLIPVQDRLPRALSQVIGGAHAYVSARRAVRRASMSRPAVDVLFTRDPEVAYFGVRHDLPVVFEVHRLPEGRRLRLVRALAAPRSPRLTVAVTSSLHRRLLDMGIPAERLVTLGGGVDLEAYEGLPPRSACRERLGLPTGRPIVGYVGRFQTMGEEKGLPELVRAMAMVPPIRDVEPLLVCIGGPLNTVPVYQELAGRVGLDSHRLLFVDRVPTADVPMWLRALDAGAMPFPATRHYAENMSPMKLFEYLAAGLPIVATDLPAVREVLVHGHNAELVPPGDDRALATAITKVLGEREYAERLAANAGVTARRHTWERRARAILDAAVTVGHRAR